MAKHLRTLLLVGLTGALGALSGCIVDTGGRPGPGSGGNCLDGQVIQVQWLIDSGPGTAPMGCAATPATSVVLTMASGVVYSVPGTCDDRYPPYNWLGQTPSGVLANDYVTSFQLVQTSSPQTVLSTGGVFSGPSNGNPPVPSCQPLLLTYLFGLNM
jgi:hypothetical protein